MKAKFSPLQLLDFKLLESHYEFIVPKNEEINVKELFQSYPVDIDFGIGKTEVDGEIQLFTKIEVNRAGKKPLAGYKLMVEGGGTFQIQDPDNVEEGLRNNLSQFSTLNMMINNLRNILYQITNLGPMGGYLLPPIDITQLLKDKSGNQE
ncbi:preprotein translocase subunit SecB [Algoriphagus sp. H41]|uniref:Preprotein translocase subunit SecB n=1 Tax=Algoriphagus oliviformis TaxID=2811231 RepID=A0ABS3C1Z7_9BACT|nr:preprotein translocase subunit SecB [Algoriphagus oliviformis]MBN7810962.1 preprotein translocase subunit SecB [Algoriphagus oliviformis]